MKSRSFWGVIFFCHELICFFFYVGDFRMGYYFLRAGFRAIPDPSCCGVSWAKHIRDGNLAREGKCQKQYSYEGKSTENKIHTRQVTLKNIHALA